MPVQVEGFVNASEILRGGVYILCHQGKIVYVGKSKRMLNRIQAHLSVWATKKKEKLPSWLPIRGIYFDEVLICPCHPDRIDALEAATIDRYRPKYNTQLKSPGPITAPFNIRVGNVVLPFGQREISSQPLRRRA